MTATISEASHADLLERCLAYIDQTNEAFDRIRELTDKYDAEMRDAAEARGSLRYTQAVLAKRDAEINSMKAELSEADDIISNYHDALLTALQVAGADLCHDCNGDGDVAVEVGHQARNGSFVQPTGTEWVKCERCRGIGREW